jgi:6-phosphogluconolactonase
VTVELVVLPDEEALAARAASWVADLARSTVAARGHFRLAVSGGKTPWAMFATLTQSVDVPWASVEVFQVDERVAPEGDDARNLTHLRAALSAVPAVVRPMPVNAPDLDGAAAAYGRELPAQFDLVHLGLGPDGHTASLVPGDPVLDVTDRLVAVTQPYQGHRRMTLTYPALGRAEQLLWLVGGADKRDALAKLLAGDPSVPAGRVTAPRSTVMTDTAAAP